MENIVESEVVIQDKYKDTDVITDIIYDGKEEVTLKDIQYMCNFNRKYNGGCRNCIFNNGRMCYYARLLHFFNNDINQLKGSILNWLFENPPTSFLMDIREKMQGIPIDKDYNIPNICVKNLYGDKCKNCELCNPSKFEISNETCRRCWRKPIVDPNEDSEDVFNSNNDDVEDANFY